MVLSIEIINKNIGREGCGVLGIFKEYQVSEARFSDWLPWGALVEPHLLLNKDNSMMATFVFERLLGAKEESVDAAIEGLCEQLLRMDSGWSLSNEVINTREGVPNVYNVCVKPLCLQARGCKHLVVILGFGYTSQ